MTNHLSAVQFRPLGRAFPTSTATPVVGEPYLAPAPPADELLCFPFGLEDNAARRLVKTGELRARKIGRRWYAKRSDVLALIDCAPVQPPAKAAGVNKREDLAAIAAKTRRGMK